MKYTYLNVRHVIDLYLITAIVFQYWKPETVAIYRGRNLRLWEGLNFTVLYNMYDKNDLGLLESSEFRFIKEVLNNIVA